MELVGYYAYKSGAHAVERADIVSELRRRLPDYMVPSFLEELAALPMTVSDKVDTRRLPKPTSLRVGNRSERDRGAPSNDDERFIAAALAESLKMEVTSVEDHFLR